MLTMTTINEAIAIGNTQAVKGTKMWTHMITQNQTQPIRPQWML